MTCMRDGFVEGLVLDGHFESISPLNHGSFGMVFLAKDLNNGELVAIKCLGKVSSDKVCQEVSVNDHLLELACHDRLGYHPNIVNLISAFETGAHQYLVLEFCSMGDLYEAIRLGRGPLETEHVRDFMFQLIGAVEFMHRKGLYHRDIKPENIFLAQDGSMKLGDFGLSTTEAWTFESSVGSDRYMSPEQYDPADTGYSPAQADIWAIGICLLNILFSRNPFVIPSESDVLFADFVRDKKSLFDIFPNMSQDTFEVLVHALAIEPQKRSLSALREALELVVSFTTDDDLFDDFCTEEREVVPASANRQPLRTPSIQSPPIEQGGAFPWAKALHMSPPQTARQLSAINEDLFPALEKDSVSWISPVADIPSVASLIDSALGASVTSMNLREPKPRNMLSSNATPLSGSLPTTASKPIPAMSSVFGIKDAMVSKSWSDMWEEDEEDEVEDTRRRFNGLNWSSESIDEDVTIRRPALAETSSSLANDLAHSPPDLDNGTSEGRSSEDTGSFMSLPKPVRNLPTYSPPSKRSIMDKWAALGKRRRAVDPKADLEEKQEVERKPSTSGSRIWRRGFGGSFGMKSGFRHSNSGARLEAWERKTRDKDVPSFDVKIRHWRRDQQPQHYNPGQDWTTEEEDIKDKDKDDGDLEWVGGWHDLQL